MSSLLDRFSNPPAAFRPMPFYVWHTEVTEEIITEDLKWMAEKGFGGFFIHPRPGLLTEYLSDRWFQLWKHALETSKQLGIECNIYDENSYPSGFAGGHVVATLPHAVCQFIGARWLPAAKLDRMTRVKALEVFVLRPDGTLELLDRNAPLPDSSVQTIVIQLEPARKSTWSAGFSYVDLMRPEVTDLFLKITHEAYAAHFGADFGSHIRYAFTDEPDIAFGFEGLNFSRYFQREFRIEHGYDLLGKIESLCFPCEDSAAVRHDYFWTANRLFVSNYARKCHDWCEGRGIGFTGHFMEHHWPRPIGSPSGMAVLRWMHAPGLDLLGFQFDHTCLEKNSKWFVNVKEIASVARQVGRERVLCETCGGGGFGFGVREMKSLEDFAMGLGVNLVNPHYVAQTLAGARKYDWPQFISQHAPWEGALAAHTSHVGRVCYAMAKAVERNRVLVLHPTTTGWLHYRPKCFHLPNENADAPLSALETAHNGFCASLYAAQVDYDLGDELILEELGKMQNGKLHAGECAYDLLVIPPLTQNLLLTTEALLRKWLEAGGRVASMADTPSYVNGRPSSAIREMAEFYPSQWHRCNSVTELVEFTRKTVPPRLVRPDGGPLRGGVIWRLQELPSGDHLLFLANPWEQPFEETICIPGLAATELDTVSGSRHPQAVTSPDGQTALSVRIESGDHRLFQIHKAPQQEVPPAPLTSSKMRPVEMQFLSAELEEDNVLLIDYCDLEAEGVKHADIATACADAANFIAQGIDQNLAQAAIQYRRTFVEWPVPVDAWFATIYRWDMEFNPSGERFAVGVERPWLYSSITVNGHLLDSSDAEPWFDREMRRLDISQYIRAGENNLRMEARPFTIGAEIAPIHLLGSFRLSAAPRGFSVQPHEPLHLGNWSANGAPFYSGLVKYRFHFETAADSSTARIRVADWKGSFLSVSIDGKTVATTSRSRLTWCGQHSLGAGNHICEVLVGGNLKNRFGPHFSDSVSAPTVWQYCPKHMPGGADYRLHSSGLEAAPTLEIGELNTADKG